MTGAIVAPPIGRAPVLEITTTRERRVVRINGADFVLTDPADLGLRDRLEVERRQARAQALVGVENPDDEQLAELIEALGWLSRLLLKAPEEVHAKLSDMHRLAIIKAAAGDAAPASPTPTPVKSA